MNEEIIKSKKGYSVNKGHQHDLPKRKTDLCIVDYTHI